MLYKIRNDKLINNLIMETKLTEETRVESDLIGAREIPASALYGVQTLRGIENFPISKFHLNEYPLFINGLAIRKWQLQWLTMS